MGGTSWRQDSSEEEDGEREGRREEEEKGGAFAGSRERRVRGCKGAVRGKDEGLSPLPPDWALRASVGAAWQGVACCPRPPTPKGTRTDPAALAGPTQPGPLSADGGSARARCAGSCGREQAGG